MDEADKRSDDPSQPVEHALRLMREFASFREAWERAIEDGLFHGVVRRFQRDVQPLKIRDVEVTQAQTQEIFDGMTETSPFHHSASLAKPVPTPTLNELKAFSTASSASARA